MDGWVVHGLGTVMDLGDDKGRFVVEAPSGIGYEPMQGLGSCVVSAALHLRRGDEMRGPNRAYIAPIWAGEA